VEILQSVSWPPGRNEARTGLRMMPTFPRSSLKFRTVGFPSVRLQGRYVRRAFLPSAKLAVRQFASALRAPRCL
jgi:hypothetical protein